MDLFSSIGIQEIVMILVIALIFVGPGKIVEFGTTAGRMINNLKKTSADMTTTLRRELLEEKKQQVNTPATPVKNTENQKSSPPDEKTA